MKTKRILLCCENYPPSVGGVQEVMRQIAERLAAKGHSVTVATGLHPSRPVDATISNVRVISFDITGNLVRGLRGETSRYRSFLANGTFDAWLVKAAQQWTFDAAIDVLPHMAARRVFIPCGFSGLHDPSYEGYFAQMPGWLAHFDALVFYSDHYQDIAFARQHGLTRLHLIPNGVDEREFFHEYGRAPASDLGIAPSDDVLLSVGSLIAAKGHWEVLRAFAKARLPRPATLVINGNQPGRGLATRGKRLIKHLLTGRLPLSVEALRVRGSTAPIGPRKRVLIVDLPRHALLRLYGASSLFIFASHVEYSPLVLFEAAAAGTPFLSSNAGNSSEIAEWTGAGVVIPRRPGTHDSSVSPADLAIAMGGLLSNPSALKAMGRAGRLNVRAKGLTWSAIVDRYEALLDG